MRVLVVSDNHGNKESIEEALKEKHDLAIHLGDGEISVNWLKKNFDYIVCGNHEYWDPSEITIEIEGLKILLAHGHTLGISMFNTEKTIRRILETTDVDMIMHGHTHMFSFGEHQDKTWLCPGALNLSRGKEGNGYTIIDIEDKKIKNVMFKGVKWNKQ